MAGSSCKAPFSPSHTLLRPPTKRWKKIIIGLRINRNNNQKKPQTTWLCLYVWRISGTHIFASRLQLRWEETGLQASRPSRDRKKEEASGAVGFVQRNNLRRRWITAVLELGFLHRDAWIVRTCLFFSKGFGKMAASSLPEESPDFDMCTRFRRTRARAPFAFWPTASSFHLNSLPSGHRNEKHPVGSLFLTEMEMEESELCVCLGRRRRERL